jgi:hypothetical protein
MGLSTKSQGRFPTWEIIPCVPDGYGCVKMDVDGLDSAVQTFSAGGGAFRISDGVRTGDWFGRFWNPAALGRV